MWTSTSTKTALVHDARLPPFAADPEFVPKSVLYVGDRPKRLDLHGERGGVPVVDVGVPESTWLSDGPDGYLATPNPTTPGLVLQFSATDRKNKIVFRPLVFGMPGIRNWFAFQRNVKSIELPVVLFNRDLDNDGKTDVLARSHDLIDERYQETLRVIWGSGAPMASARFEGVLVDHLVTLHVVDTRSGRYIVGGQTIPEGVSVALWMRLDGASFGPVERKLFRERVTRLCAFEAPGGLDVRP